MCFVTILMSREKKKKSTCYIKKKLKNKYLWYNILLEIVSTVLRRLGKRKWKV